MWELIRANKRKSIILMIVMGAVLLTLGYFVGASYAGIVVRKTGVPHDTVSAGKVGVAIAFGIWLIQSIIAYFAGGKIVLATSGAREITHDSHPQLFNIVEEMKIAANLPTMPKIFIIPDQTPNAFATGTKPQNCAIAVTAGLLGKLNRDELQGVIAHEMSHILNRDVLFMTYAATVMGTIVLISEIYLRSLWFSGGSSRRHSGKSSGGGQAQMVMMVIAIALAILSPILAQMLYFAISRKREYLADACAVRLTRYPQGLASALSKISGGAGDMQKESKILRPLYISDPKQGAAALSSLGSTHPPIADRIKILRKISGSAGFESYNRAYSKISGKKCGFMPESAKTEKDFAIRQASVEAEKPLDNKGQARNVGDMIMAANSFAFLQCKCGMKMKLPPGYDKSKVTCPRCKTIHAVPMAEFAGVMAGMNAAIPDITANKKTPAQPPKKLTYHRKSKGSWESFKCRCGHLQQVSPVFKASHLTCKACKSRIEIK